MTRPAAAHPGAPGAMGPLPALGAELRQARPFLALWLGHFISTLGSRLTTFALPVWVYRTTGSAEQLGLLLFLGTMPRLLLAPLAGAVVDRWDRRTVLLASTAAAALRPAALGVLAATGTLQVWHLFIIWPLGSALSAAYDPAFAASIPLMVPRRQFGRAVGLVQAGLAVCETAAPVLGALLVAGTGLGGILAIDVASFLVAMAVLLAIRIPPVPREAGAGPRASLWAQAARGWRFIQGRPGLIGLLWLVAGINCATGFLYTLVYPAVLGFGTAASLGLVLALSGAGALAGSVVLGVWGGGARRMRVVVAGSLAMAACTVLAGVRPSAALMGAAFFGLSFAAPLVDGCAQAIWMVKTPLELQGRVFALRRMVSMITSPAAMLASGPLADRVFEPLMARGGPLAGSVGRVLGTGPGRGVGLLYVVAGALLGVLVVGLARSPRVRRLEDDMPDAIPGPQAAGAEGEAS